jgi:hypothetical protein
MQHRLIGQAFALLTVLSTTQAAADATLVFAFTEPDGTQLEKTLSITGFWTRVDDPREEEQFLLYQAGKFFPLYRVDTSKKTYTLLTPPVTPTLGPLTRSEVLSVTEEKASAPAEAAGTAAPASTASEEAVEATASLHAPTGPTADAEPASASAPEKPKPNLKPTSEKRTIAGVECRIVTELVNGEPVMEHCMANTPRLGTTNRDVITLARFFAMAREMDLGWWGIGSNDEQFVAVQSRDLKTGRIQELKSLSRAPLPPDHMRVPRTFTEVVPNADPAS